MNSDQWAVENPTGTGPWVADAPLSQPPESPPPWHVPEPPPRQEAPLDGVSVAAFVVGLLGLVPVAVVLGILGVLRTRLGVRRGRRFAVLGFVLASVWTLVASCAVLPGAGPSYTSFSYHCDADRCVSRSEASRWLSGRATTIIDGPVHVKSSEVVAAVGISEISDGRATFAFEEDAVTVDVGRVMLVGYASIHLMAVDGETVRFAVDFSPAVVSADDVEAWISWELGIDREQARCPSDLVAEVGAWITCTADSRDRTSAEVEVTLQAVRDADVELAVEVVSPPEPRPSQPSGADDSA